MAAGWLFVAQPFPVALAGRLGIFNDRQVVFQTEPVTGPAHGEGGTPKVAVLSVVALGHGVIYDVVVNVAPVNVGRNDKLIPAFCPAHGKLIADTLGVLRGDLTGGEGLPNLIKQHVLLMVQLAARGVLILLLAQEHFSGGGGLVAAVGGYQFAAPRLGWIHSIVQPFMDGIGGGIALMMCMGIKRVVAIMPPSKQKWKHVTQSFTCFHQYDVIKLKS